MKIRMKYLVKPRRWVSIFQRTFQFRSVEVLQLVLAAHHLTQICGSFCIGIMMVLIKFAIIVSHLKVTDIVISLWLVPGLRLRPLPLLFLGNELHYVQLFSCSVAVAEGTGGRL